MAIPKITLKIELIETNAVRITLVQVTDVYTKSPSLLSSGRSIHTSNNWMIYVGSVFSINKKNRIVVIPKTPYKEKDYLYFDNDTERKDTLRELHIALLEWSDNILFSGKVIFSEKPRMRTHKNIWIIF